MATEVITNNTKDRNRAVDIGVSALAGALVGGGLVDYFGVDLLPLNKPNTTTTNPAPVPTPNPGNTTPENGTTNPSSANVPEWTHNDPALVKASEHLVVVNDPAYIQGRQVTEFDQKTDGIVDQGYTKDLDGDGKSDEGKVIWLASVDKTGNTIQWDPNDKGTIYSNVQQGPGQFLDLNNDGKDDITGATIPTYTNASQIIHSQQIEDFWTQNHPQ